jgi:hypothetical protein
MWTLDVPIRILWTLDVSIQYLVAVHPVRSSFQFFVNLL